MSRVMSTLVTLFTHKVWSLMIYLATELCLFWFSTFCLERNGVEWEKEGKKGRNQNNICGLFEPFGWRSSKSKDLLWSLMIFLATKLCLSWFFPMEKRLFHVTTTVPSHRQSVLLGKWQPTCLSRRSSSTLKLSNSFLPLREWLANCSMIYVVPIINSRPTKVRRKTSWLHTG